MSWISPVTKHRLEVQGFVGVDRELLAETARWLRLSHGLCAVLAAVGTYLSSPALLLAIVPFPALGAVFPVHPFDLIYNLGIRHIKGAPPLPKRGTPGRFACGLTAAWLVATAVLFMAGMGRAGTILGGLLVLMNALAAINNMCLPSMIYRLLFGWPEYAGT